MSISRSDIPSPLVVAASLAGLEGVLLLGYGVAELVSLSGQRLTMGLTTGVFFIVYGAVLTWCAWSVTWGKSWARSPIVFAQLIQLGVAFSFWGGQTTVVAVVLVVAAAVTVVGLLHPRSVGYLADEPAGS